jgi:protein-S-isoprenylcysteine O-methyltransferase Ste14
MVETVEVIYWINLILGFLLIFAIAISIIFPEKRIWPPPSKKSWQFWYIWGFCGLWLIAGFGLFLLDWHPSLFPWIRYPIGIIIVILGNFLAFWGMKTLSTHQTLGLDGILIRDGPYRFSRNPQYVGDILILLGFIILAGSWRVSISFGLAISWFVFTPFSEEPWLRAQYGEEFDKYTKEISRYFSIQKRKKNN